MCTNFVADEIGEIDSLFFFSRKVSDVTIRYVTVDVSRGHCPSFDYITYAFVTNIIDTSFHINGHVFKKWMPAALGFTFFFSLFRHRNQSHFQKKKSNTSNPIDTVNTLIRAAKFESVLMYVRLCVSAISRGTN